MNTSEKIDLLIPALLLARTKMKPAFKGKTNSHFKYQFANEEAWHDAVQPALQDNGLYLCFSADRSERAGSLTTIWGSARITHTSGQWLQINGVGEGSDNADKGAYKAQTGLKKYLYALAFALPTTDDPEDDANDKARASEFVRKVVKEAKPAATTADVNAERVAQGLEPEIDEHEKMVAMDCFAQLKALGPVALKRAQEIKRQCGKDYGAMVPKLKTALHEELEGVANESVDISDSPFHLSPSGK